MGRVRVTYEAVACRLRRCVGTKLGHGARRAVGGATARGDTERSRPGNVWRGHGRTGDRVVAATFPCRPVAHAARGDGVVIIAAGCVGIVAEGGGEENKEEKDEKKKEA